MSHTRLVAHNTIVQVVARFFTTIISILAFGYVARYLGVVGYGQYNLIFAYLSLFGVLVDFGFFLLQVREITKTPEKEAEILGNVLGMKIVLSLVAFSLAIIVGAVVYHDPIITLGIAVGSISQATIALANVPISLFQARLQMQYIAIMNVVTRALYLGLTVWAIKQGLGVVGIIGMVAISNAFSYIWQQAWANRITKVVPRWDFLYWRKFVIDAFPLGMAVVLAMIYFRVDTVILSFLKGNYEVGIYGAPYKIIEVILTLPTIFMSSVFPIMTRALSTGHEQAQRIFRKAFDFAALLSFPIAFGVIAVATPLMATLAGAEFAPSGAVLQWLIWATTLSFFGAVMNYTIIAAGKQQLLLWPYLAATIFNITANLLLIPKYSYMGAAVTTIGTELVVGVWIFCLVIYQLKLTPSLLVFGKALGGSLVMYGVLRWLNSPNLYLNVLVGGAVYAAAVLLTRAVSKDVYKEVFRAR